MMIDAGLSEACRYADRPTHDMALTWEAVQQAYEQARQTESQPMTLILHPAEYAGLMRALRIWNREAELLGNETVRRAWLAGWQARSKRAYSRRRMNREWVTWCLAQATEQIDAEIAAEAVTA